MSYTKGPWTFIEEEPRALKLRRRHYAVGQDGGGDGVALVFGDDCANARLIAAAPELLEELAADTVLLKKLLQLIDRNFHLESLIVTLAEQSWMDALHHRIDSNELTIAKAEGR